jgi:transposase
MCPGNHESAGKRHGGKPRKGNQHLQHVLVECAWSATRTPGYLQSLYRWHVRKFGGPRSPQAKNKAIVAIAHKLTIIIWHVLATGEPFHDLGAEYLDHRIDPERETRRLVAKLEKLGHSVTLAPAA